MKPNIQKPRSTQDKLADAYAVLPPYIRRLEEVLRGLDVPTFKIGDGLWWCNHPKEKKLGLFVADTPLLKAAPRYWATALNRVPLILDLANSRMEFALRQAEEAVAAGEAFLYTRSRRPSREPALMHVLCKRISKSGDLTGRVLFEPGCRPGMEVELYEGGLTMEAADSLFPLNDRAAERISAALAEDRLRPGED